MAISVEELADALRVDNVDDQAVRNTLGFWLAAARDLNLCQGETYIDGAFRIGLVYQKEYFL